MNYIALKNQITRRIMLIACTTALTLGLMVSLPQLAQAQSVTPPIVPDNKLQVEPGNEAFLVGHAVGTQNYICKPSGAGVKFVLFTPEATLFNNEGKQLTTHFFSPNPAEPNLDPTVQADGTIRATWQDSRDTSTVWAKLHQADAAV